MSGDYLILALLLGLLRRLRRPTVGGSGGGCFGAGCRLRHVVVVLHPRCRSFSPVDPIIGLEESGDGVMAAGSSSTTKWGPQSYDEPSEV